MMTNDELQAIKARAEAATPGPWTTGAGKINGETRELVIAPNDDVIVAIAYGGFGNPVDRTTEDRTFIAHARTDVPALIAEVERLTKITEIALRPETVYATHVHEIARQHGNTATDDAIGRLAASIACERAILQALTEVGVQVK